LTEARRDNLLVALHRLAHRQDENFVTETFAHLVRHLLRYEPDVAVGLIASLTDDRVVLSPRDADTVTVRTQVTTDEGRPDIEISTADHLIFVEAKAESGLGWEQLPRYRKALDADEHPNKTLVLLTRHTTEDREQASVADTDHRWYEVGGFLKQRMASGACKHEKSGFLVSQFAGFLQARGMLMERVRWEYTNGIRALWNLMKMLEEVVHKHTDEVIRSVGQQWAGYYLDGKRGWVGIGWEEAAWLTFQSEEMTFDKAAADSLEYGEARENKYSPCGFKWYYEKDLESEEVHFFARSQESQMQWLEAFV
jgi:hypothetical protein